MVNTHYEGRRCLILRRGGDDYFFRSLIDMYHRFFRRIVRACTFHNVFRAAFAPRDIGSVALTVDRHFLAVDYNSVLVYSKVFGKTSENRIVFEHIHHILLVRVAHIDSADVDVLIVHRRANYHSRNTAKTTDTNFNCHFVILLD